MNHIAKATKKIRVLKDRIEHAKGIAAITGEWGDVSDLTYDLHQLQKRLDTLHEKHDRNPRRARSKRQDKLDNVHRANSRLGLSGIRSDVAAAFRADAKKRAAPWEGVGRRD